MNPHPLMSMRLLEQPRDPALLAEHLALLKRQRGACDEVWLASEYGFPALAFHQACATQMAAAAAQFRAAGLGASLQISNTLGHGAAHRSLDFSGLTWQRMMAVDGTVSPWSSCPRAPEFHTYLEALTRAYCAWQPDCLWIDDDLRMNHHDPVLFGCFCDTCLAGFKARTGRAWTRDAFGHAINEGNEIAVREAWLEFGRESMADVARTVGRAALAVAPGCRLGFQHCDPAWAGYNGPDWAPVFKALRDVSGRRVGSRPGQGFYVDHRPREMLTKALFTGLQNARLTEDIEISSYECENLPGTVTGKSARGTALECTLALANGCNSLSFTPLMFAHETTEWHERVLSELAAWRPFWTRYLAVNERTVNTGIEMVLSRRQALRQLNVSEQPFAWASCSYDGFPQLASIGLPLCWNEKAPAALLCGQAAWGVDETELRGLLARGLMMDGETVEVLGKRGLSEVLGLRSTPIGDEWGNITLTDDSLNRRFAGTCITCGGFTFGTARSFEHLKGEIRCLARYSNVHGKAGDRETVALSFEDGGRLVVFGWGLFNPTVPTARRHQILEAANWLARGTMPVTLETPCQVVMVPRHDAAGRLVSVLLLNVSLDPTPPMTLSMPPSTGGGEWGWMRPFSPDVALKESQGVVVPSLEPWGVGVLARRRRA